MIGTNAKGPSQGEVRTRPVARLAILLAAALLTSLGAPAAAQTTATLEVTAESPTACVIAGGPVLPDLAFGQHQAGDVVTTQPHDQFSVSCNSNMPVSVGIDQGQHFAFDFNNSCAGFPYSRSMAQPGVALLIPYALDAGIGVNPNLPGGGGSFNPNYFGVPNGSGAANLTASDLSSSTPIYYIDITVRLCNSQLPETIPSGMYEDLLTINLVW